MKQNLILACLLMLSLQTNAARLTGSFEPIEGKVGNCMIAPEATTAADRISVHASFEFQVCAEYRDGDQLSYRLEKREGAGFAVAMESTGLNLNAARAEAMNQCVQKIQNVKMFSNSIENSRCAGQSN